MSSTGRGRERREADYYPTPPWCVQRLLDRVPELLQSDVYLEPCVGDGAILRGFPRLAERQGWFVNDIRTTALLGCEHQSVRRRAVGDARDWLPFSWWPGTAKGLPTHCRVACITNPPFTHAQAIIEAAVIAAHLVAFLLPVTYPRPRAAWWREHPANLYLLPDRPSFDGRGSDATEYGWFVFGLPPAPFQILDDTPRTVRAAAEEEARALVAGLDLPVDPQQELFG